MSSLVWVSMMAVREYAVAIPWDMAYCPDFYVVCGVHVVSARRVVGLFILFVDIRL